MELRSFAIAALLLAGCVSVGREVRQDQLTEFQRGLTTEQDVVGKLGSPTSSTVDSRGQRELAYVYMHSQPRPETFIPIIGGFVGGADTRTSQVVFVFGRDGKLLDYRATESNVGSGMGAAANSYQPRTDQPTEATK